MPHPSPADSRALPTTGAAPDDATSDDRAGPLSLVRLHHIGRRTERLDECIAFYRDVMGFKEVSRPGFTFPGAWLENYGLQIHLIVYGDASDGSVGPIEPKHNHLAFWVQDVTSIGGLLRQHGIEYRENIQAGTGVKQLFFRDPDGNHLEVGTYPEPAAPPVVGE